MISLPLVDIPAFDKLALTRQPVRGRYVYDLEDDADSERQTTTSSKRMMTAPAQDAHSRQQTGSFQ
jgi:hypothetical protein